MNEHELYREVVEHHQYRVEVRDGELLTRTDEMGAYMGSEERATVVCACGDRFIKPETAIAHLAQYSAD